MVHLFSDGRPQDAKSGVFTRIHGVARRRGSGGGIRHRRILPVGGKRKTWILICILLLLIVLIGLAVIYLCYNRPADKALFIEPFYHIDTEEKVVALTFDDGPSPTWTPEVVDVLDRHSAVGTFFMLGENAEKYPDVVRYVQSHGHEIGSHSYNHIRLIFRWPGVVREQIEKADAALEKAGAEPTCLFRPPNLDKMIVTPLVMKKLGKVLVSLDAEAMLEYDRDNTDSDALAAQIVAAIRPGSILDLHDGRSHDPTVFLDALDKALTELTEQGYRFVTVSEGLKMAGR